MFSFAEDQLQLRQSVGRATTLLVRTLLGSLSKVCDEEGGGPVKVP
jgi:hypothetical protein